MDVAIVRVQQEMNLEILFTFGLDCISIWNMNNGKLLDRLDVSSYHGRSICGGAAQVFNSEFSRIVVAFATHNEPIVHFFDYDENATVPLAQQSRDFDVASNYCRGHQQDISSMRLTHDGQLLATSSWDSTCMLWKVCPVKSAEMVRLTLLIILPVHEEGVSSLAFTVDDQNLVTCGECIVKVWDISNLSANNQVKNNQDGTATSLDNQLQEWEQAIPFSFSIESTVNLFAFDESMTSLIANHEWLHLGDNGREQTLVAPAQSEEERNEVVDVKQCLEHLIEEIDPNDDEFEKILKTREKGQEGNRSGNNDANDELTLTAEESARLRTQFRSMKDFDFEKLFTPALSFLDEDNAAISTKSVTRSQSCPDASGRLLRTFSSKTKDGVFSSHSSMITGCALAQELDLVVTVALDKSIRYWSLDQGVVLETVFDAHDAPITCCALTSPTTCDLNLFEMLLATGGSDNLIKVWRRHEPKPAECVFTLSGHNDTIRSVAFDPSGVFLVSSSEDTTAMMWRVRPSFPDQPEVPVVVSVDRFSITISWTEPLANGAKILRYIVRTTHVSSYSGDDREFVSIPDTETPVLASPLPSITTLSCTLDELWAGEVYQFVVAASNRCGLGQFSRVSDYVKMDCTAPDQPEKPVVGSVDKRQIDVQWTKPRCNGSEVLQYTLRWSQEIEEVPVINEQSIVLLTRSIATTKYTVTGLEPGHPVQVWISASNLVDNKLLTSPESVPSDSMTTLCDVPNAPVAPELLEPSAHTLMLAWTPPKHNGLPIDGYTVTIYSEDTQFGVRGTPTWGKSKELEATELEV
ncbi:hypothetical protein PInf_014367 [Phytophthora infestans]|nr:hypothetical protein PInf_014367 [Phytophthora infestans]